MSAAPGRTVPPSGRQFEIRLDSQRAVVTEVGATLRSYTIGADHVVDGFDVEEMASGAAGQVLAPWPNRLGDGHYTFEGQTGRVPLDEPERVNAIHGLVRWLAWTCVEQSESAVRLQCVLEPQPAYHWRLRLEIEFRLTASGLAVSTTATNLSATRAPFGIGFHPYLTVGTPTIDTASLALPARRRLLMDDRQLPVGDEPVTGSAYDFVAGRAIADMVLDTDFTDLVRAADGTVRAMISAADGGRRTTLWMGPDFRHLMVFTGDTLQPPERRRRAVALEPMTCPPDGLRSGTDLIAIDPGEHWTGAWGLDPT